MSVNKKVYFFGVVFVYTVTAITSPSGGRSSTRTEPYKDDLTMTVHPFRKRLQLTSQPGGGGGEVRGYSGGKPEHRMTTDSTSLEEEFSTSQSHGNCSRGQIKHVIHGKFYINGQLEPNILNQDYQSDSAVSVQAQGGRGAGVRGQRLSSLEEIWQKLQPAVECGDDGMTLTVRRRRAAQLQLHRVNESSLPLSQLSPHCGYTVQTSWRDLSLMAQYDACHVTQEGESYVLPLLWRGTPAKMSCPLSDSEPQASGLSSLCCSPDGMTIKLQGPSASGEQRIAVRGEWTPLPQLAEQCGYTLDRQDAQTVIAAPFITCGITVKDGKHTLSLQSGEKIFTLGCPIFPPEEQPVTHQPLINSHHHQTQDALGSLLWPPPFYLAPPNYPHPTHHHGHAAPKASTPEPTISLLPPPPVDSQPGYQDQNSHRIPERDQVPPDKNPNQQTPLTDPSERHSAPPGGFPAQAESPQFKPLSQDFSPYYHYYHLPKIPLPGTNHDPDPGLDISAENSHNPVLPTDIQQPESQTSLPHPRSLSDSHPIFPFPLHAPYPYYYYFPHIVHGETKNQDVLHPDEEQTELSSLHKRPHSAEPSVRSMSPNVNEPNTDINIEELLSDDVEREVDENRCSSSEADPPPEEPPPTTPQFIYVPHPYQTYYQPYYQMHYGPEGFSYIHSSPAQHQTAAPTELYYKLYQPIDSEEVAASEPQFPSGGAESGYPSIPQSFHDLYTHFISQQHLYDDLTREAEKLDSKTQVSDVVLEPPVLSSEDAHVSFMLQPPLTSDVLIVPVYDCGVNCDVVVDPLEAGGLHPPFIQDESEHESSPVGWMVGCGSSINPPGDMMDQPPLPPIQPKLVSVNLRIDTDESFSSFHPEPHLPLSLLQGRTLYLEVKLLDPPEPNLLLLVHSCWAYTQDPCISWMLVYDGCLSQSVLQLLPSPDSHHIRRIRISNFLSLSPKGSSHKAPLEDPEIYFLCLAEVCSAADNGCKLNCKGANSDV